MFKDVDILNSFLKTEGFKKTGVKGVSVLIYCSMAMWG
jgi:hypothetical protein